MDKNKVIKYSKRVFKILRIFLLVLIITGLSVSGFIYLKYKDQIKKSVNNGFNKVSKITLSTFNNRYPTIIVDKNGKVIKEFKNFEYVYKPYKEINPLVFKALISIEDERFEVHNGVDYVGIMRSSWTIIKSKGKKIQGGSTITQQLARNIFLNFDKTAWRKLEEIVIAQEIEKRYSKEEIIEFYLNNVNFGNGAYSIESASKFYFNKSTKKLSLAEVASLIAIPNNPSLYNPIKNPENNIKRRNLILFKMLEFKNITKEEYEKAKSEKLKLNINKVRLDNSVTDYAQSFAVYNAVEILMEQNGFNFRRKFNDDLDRQKYFKKYQTAYDDAREQFISGGYKIETSIDTSLQNKLQLIVDEKLSGYIDKNKKNGLYIKQSSVTTIDNKTGEVVAIVGGRSEKGNSFNRAYLGARQPGSIIKPIIAYTPAFESGYIPDSYMRDNKFKNSPNNYDGVYRGEVNLRYATEISINSIPFKLLLEMGTDKSLQKLYDMDFKYITPEDNNPIIAIGGFTRGVTTVEMAGAYSTLSRNGEFIKPTNVRKITLLNSKEVIYNNDHSKIRVYDSDASYLMTDVLKGVVNKSYGTGYKVRLRNYPYQAGKTGTTNESKDAWFSGYTPYYTTTVWVGDDIPAPQHMAGGGLPGMIWRDFMEHLHNGLEVIDFIKPNSVNKENGKLISTSYIEGNRGKSKAEAERIRKEKETEVQKNVIVNEQFFNKYGITKEENDSIVGLANRAIDGLMNYRLADVIQYSEVDSIIKNTRMLIARVVDKDKVLFLNQRLDIAIQRINGIKAELDKQLKEAESAKEPVEKNEENTESNKEELNIQAPENN